MGLWVSIVSPSPVQGCHGQGKVRENQKFFKVREKSGNFAKGQGKSQFLSKSVKSQGILFSGFVKFMKTFSFGKKEVVVDQVMRSNGRFFGQSMPWVQNPVKNGKRLKMKRTILMVCRRN